MKNKFAIFIFLFAVSFVVHAQNKYKVEINASYQLSTGVAGEHKINPFNGATRLTPINNDFIEANFVSTDAATVVTLDEIVEYAQPITQFQHFSSYFAADGNDCNNSVFRPFDGCTIESMPGCFRPVFTSSRVVALEDFLANNPITQIDPCELKTINVHSTCGFSYSVWATYKNTAGTISSREILPYALRGSSFDFKTDLLLDLAPNAPSVSIQVYYTDKTNPPTNEKSAPLFLIYTPCPFKAESVIGLPPRCFGGDDGGFTVVFEEDLESNAQLIFTYKKQETDITFGLPPVTSSSLGFVGRSYTYRGIDQGNYDLTWQLAPIVPGEFPVVAAPDEPFTVPLNTNITDFIFVSNNETCVGAQNGSIIITPQGGTPPYEYSIANGDNGSFINSNTFNDLVPGNYQIVVRDANGCTSDPDAATINEGASPPAITYLSTSTPFAQNGQGVIEVFVDGGTSPYIFKWTKDGVPFTPSNPSNLTGLDTGSYRLSITDDNGCVSDSSQEPFVIGEIPALSVTIAPQSNGTINCEGETLTLEATPTGGTGSGYSYEWFNGPIIDNLRLSETSRFINVGQGEYTVRVTDSDNTTATSLFTLNYENPLMTVMADKTDVVCKGEKSGIINLTINGGAPPYQVFWDGSFTATTEDRTDLSAGPHYYLVRDRNDCEVTNFTNQIIITEPSVAFEVTATSTDATSNGGNEGTISLALSNGGGGYDYVWTKDGALFSPPTGSTTTEIVGLQAGVYQVEITDLFGCFATLAQTVTIGEPGPLELQDPQFDMTPIDCFGTSTGSIIARYNGTAPFTFVWRDSGNNIVKTGPDDFLDNQPIGFYTYTVDDATAATPLLSDPVEITGPGSLLGATFLKTEVTCFGGADGSITVSATGGTLPYSYQLNNGIPQASGEFTDLSSGSFIVNVIDANNCSIAPLDVDLVPPTQITFEDTNAISPVSNPGGSDGSITVAVQGGAKPYFYRWSGPGVPAPINTSNTTTIENLSEGVYTLEVSNKATFDIDGCYLRRQYTVTEQPAFSIQSFTGTPTCFNQANGSLTATIVATGPVTFNWRLEDGSLVATETTNERTAGTEGRAAGNYYVELLDANDQRVQSSLFEIVELAEVSAVINPVPTCLGDATGSIRFSGATGSPSGTYSYSIDNGLTFQASPLFEGLAADSYTPRVRAFENPNCDYSAPGVVIPNSPGIFWDEPSSLTTRASGPGATDGAIAPVFTGGTAPLTFLWSANANNATSQNVNGLGAGSYSVTVTDAANCSLTQDFEVTEVGPLTITNITANDVLCRSAANGSITTTVTGEGTINYLWSLANGDPVPVSNGVDGPNITGILAGSYILTATDDNTTVATRPIEIEEPTTSVTITNINITDVSCFGGNDGTLEVQAAGGSGPYTYSLNGGPFQPTPKFTDLLANGYSVRVKDANSCEFAEPTPLLVFEPQELNLIINEQRPVTAANETDGAIFITVEGGSDTYTYDWTGPNGYVSTAKDILNIAAGDYTVTITDANFTTNNSAGCRLTSIPLTIAEPGELIANLTQTVLLECSGDDFAEITATVQGGVLPYNYQWFQVSNGSNTLLNEDTNIIGNLTAGNYFLRVSDANSVSIDTNPIPINEPTQLQITVDNKVNVICRGQSTGRIDITVSGGTAPYQYFWSNSATVSDISGLDAGEYTVEVQDAAGCIAEDTITITTPDDVVQITNVTKNNASAYEALDGSISVDISGGAAPYNYSWTRLSDNSNIGNQATISNLQADSYSVSVSDANGCTITETYEVTQPDIIEETIIQPSCSGYSNGSITVLANKGNGTFTYEWNTGAATNTISDLGSGSYTVTISGFEDGPLTRTYVLDNPAPLEVNLGADSVLCADQVLELDATVNDESATYSWSSDNGFNSALPFVVLTETGNYTVTVQSENGCTAQGTIFVDVSTAEINAEFAISSQVFVGETVVAVDISYPLPEGMEWILPVGAKVITQNKDAAEFSFAEAGEYEITIITTRGECIAQKTKKILVVAKDGLIQEEEGKSAQKIVEEFIVYPNPTSGLFTADINLSERGDVSIKVFGFANNALMASQKARGETAYSLPFDISGMPTGVYAVLLETPYGTSLRKIVVR